MPTNIKAPKQPKLPKTIAVDDAEIEKKRSVNVVPPPPPNRPSVVPPPPAETRKNVPPPPPPHGKKNQPFEQ